MLTNAELEKRKRLSGDNMQPYYHILPFHDCFILYLNGTMKYVVLTPEEHQVCLSGGENSVLTRLLSENEEMFHQVNELHLGPVGLTLNVANTCNLCCSYCYAHGGNYNSQNTLMSEDTAIRAVRQFAEYFGELKRIKFFGGEPFLNPKVIRAVCETCVELRNKGIIKELPDFTTVTNGTIINSELIDLIKMYDIGVTVSYDGNSKMQNILRPFVSGQESNDILLENIKLLQTETANKQPSSVEVTYTQVHAQEGISVEQCYNNVKHLFGIEDIKITPVSCVPTDKHHLTNIDSFQNAIISGYHRNPRDIKVVEKAYRLHQILTLKKRSERIFCGAGINRFSVGADGNVYPCYLFTNDSEFCLGNIWDTNFSLEKYEATRFRLMEYNRLTSSECNVCWASSFCFGCRGNNRLLTGDADTPSEDFCQMLKDVAENILYCMAEAGEIKALNDLEMER